MSFLQIERSTIKRTVLIPSCYYDIQPHHMVVLYTSYQLLKRTSLYRKLYSKILLLLSSSTDALLPLIYTGYIPDFLIRFGIRVQLRDRIASLQTEDVESDMLRKMQIVEELKSLPIALKEDAANEQHYEVPAAFYDMCLGPRKKYSSGLWPEAKTTFEESEVKMLELYCRRAGVQDGMRVVDLGCGWGSLTLYLLEKYPNIKVTSISNSHSQREYILCRAARPENINVITCNVSDDQRALDTVKDNDLVFSIEMFEHMKNYSSLLAKVHSFLKPGGKLFLHMFTHKSYTYHFQEGWMAANFFTGGTMVSDDLMLYFSEHFSVLRHWRVNGTHYSKTSNAWLSIMDANWKKGNLSPLLDEAYGEGKAWEWYWNWRLFFLACAELWGFQNGQEWIVSHYLFQRRH